MFADRLLLSFAIAGVGLLASLARVLAHLRSASISSRIVWVKGTRASIAVSKLPVSISRSSSNPA